MQTLELYSQSANPLWGFADCKYNFVDCGREEIGLRDKVTMLIFFATVSDVLNNLMMTLTMTLTTTNFNEDNDTTRRRNTSSRFIGFKV